MEILHGTKSCQVSIFNVDADVSNVIFLDFLSERMYELINELTELLNNKINEDYFTLMIIVPNEQALTCHQYHHHHQEWQV